MNRKSFGKSLALALTALVWVSSGCVEKIPGEPDKVVERYIKAVQETDYRTIFDINHVTAKQLKYLRQLNAGDREHSLEESYRQYSEIYKGVAPTFQPGITWAEKGFFPPGSKTRVGKPYHPIAAGDDPVNAEYEKATNVYVPVEVDYPDISTAPEYSGRKVRSALYDCGLKKIREGRNVTVYAHDDKWFFGGCIANTSKMTFYQ